MSVDSLRSRACLPSTLPQETTFNRATGSKYRNGPVVPGHDPTRDSTSSNPQYFDSMDAHHRKIDLQSPSDLTYLLDNIKAAAQQKIDLAIPRSAAPEGEDAYRSRVEELVQEVLGPASVSLLRSSDSPLIISIVYTPDLYPRPPLTKPQRPRSITNPPPSRPCHTSYNHR